MIHRQKIIMMNVIFGTILSVTKLHAVGVERISTTRENTTKPRSLNISKT
jgi:hypothetical protein